ncbi:unnamed protein product [Hermetia illucens]|uniref:Uncharacterized protein n=1 Tax=Hermetia illucens TaxID=343691 RepID=A0A7R8V2N8_HERIL|nr:unnamed protein product [Hermetia illucens]
MSAAKVQYSSREKLREPAYLHTLDGKIECTELIRTFAPEEFGVKAIINWKIANISFQNFDAIIGMDILVALGASIDIFRSELKINSNVTPFGTDIPTQIIQEFSNAIDNIEAQIDQQPDPNTHSIEEVELIERIKNEFHDLEYDSNKKLTFTHEIKHTLKLKTGNSDIEVAHRTLNEQLRIFLQRQKHEDSDLKLLDPIEQCLYYYNNNEHSVTNETPFKVFFGKTELSKIEILKNLQNKKEKWIGRSNQNRKHVPLDDKYKKNIPRNKLDLRYVVDKHNSKTHPQRQKKLKKHHNIYRDTGGDANHIPSSD